MTRTEFATLCRRVGGWWSNRQWPDASALAYWEDLKDLDSQQVMVAAEGLYRQGGDWPPTGAQIRNEVLALAADTPSWTDVWDRLLRAASKFGMGRTDEAIDWLTDWHPLAGEFARLLPFRDLCLTTEVDVFRGQARRHWETFAKRAERDMRLQGLPDAGLKTLQRVNQPAQICGALQRVLEQARPEGPGA